MVEPVRSDVDVDYSLEGDYGLSEEAKGQLKTATRWAMLRACPVACLLAALATIVVAPVFKFAAFVTFALWIAGLVGSRQGRRESGAALGYLARETGEAWTALKRASEIAHARALARRDAAPAYWASPAKDDTHQGYRDAWARLCVGSRTDAEDATLVQIARGLKNYGDDPLINPPAARLQGVAALVTPALGPLRYWTLYAIGVLVLAVGAQSLRVERLKDDVNEQRQIAVDWAARAAVAEGNLVNEQQRSARFEANQIEEQSRSLALADERDALQQRLEQRTRSRQNESQSRPHDAVVDYGERLRELAEPAAMSDLPGAAPPGDPAG